MTNLIESQATGTQIQHLVDRFVSSLPDQAPKSHVVIACLTLAIILMKDEVTSEQIQAGVKGMSEWACLFLSEDDNADKTKVN